MDNANAEGHTFIAYKIDINTHLTIYTIMLLQMTKWPCNDQNYPALNGESIFFVIVLITPQVFTVSLFHIIMNVSLKYLP